MDTKFQTSFIPKKPIGDSRGSRAGISLFLLVSLIIFFIMAGIAAWVFLEKKILVQGIASQQATISTNKTGLISDQITVQSIVDLNSRIIAAKQLLAQHISVSPVFAFFQQTTLKNVRFNNFNFAASGKDDSGKVGVSVQMSGLARDWETVASQADEFGLSEWRNIISQPKISNLSLNGDGSVSFVFTAIINPDFIVYGNPQAIPSQN